MREGVRSRLGWAAIFAALGAGGQLATPVASTNDGVAKQLGDAMGGTVGPDDYLWEPSSGALLDAFSGRLLTFAGSRGGGPRDVWRARVRVARSGRVLGVRELHQLTDTALADEGDLTGKGSRIAFRALSGAATVGLGVLLLEGDEPPADASRLERLLLSLERRLRTGSSRGLGRVDLVLAEPARELRFDLDERGLVFVVGEEVPNLVPLPPAPRGRALHQPSFAAVDRTLEAPRGASLLASLAERMGAPGLALRLRARAQGLAGSVDWTSPATLGAVEAEAVAGGVVWPPSLPDGLGWAAIARGEGTAPWLVHVRLGIPAAPVDAFAFDLRQLEFDVVPGAAPAGRAAAAPIGGLSADDHSSLVAAFALSPLGGVALGSRELSPLAVGPVAFARRGPGVSLGPMELPGPPPGGFVVQGPAASLDREPLERSVLCRTREGRLVYLHAPRASTESLRAALEQASCSASMTLAEWPTPAGLVLLGAAPRRASPGMSLSVDGLEAPAGPLVVVRRRGKFPEGAGWSPDPGEQPPPAWEPTVFQTSSQQGALSVEVLRVRSQRVRWALRVGRDEPGKQPSQPPADGLLTLGFGVTRKRPAFGLALDGDPIVKGHGVSSSGTLILSKEGRLRLERTAAGAATESALEAPLLADEGKILPEGQLAGLSRSRGALCILSDGSVLVANGELDTDEPLVLALLALGCRRVVELDRGSREGTFVARKGRSVPPAGAHAWTQLVALPVPLDAKVDP